MHERCTRRLLREFVNGLDGGEEFDNERRGRPDHGENDDPGEDGSGDVEDLEEIHGLLLSWLVPRRVERRVMTSFGFFSLTR